MKNENVIVNVNVNETSEGRRTTAYPLAPGRLRSRLRFRLRSLLLVALFACQSKKDQPSPTPGSNAPAEVDWGKCDAALKQAPAIPQTRRVGVILEGCQVCGDWGPLLRWNRAPTAPGAPKRLEIEKAMLACGYCDPSAKQRFLGTLDDARGTPTRTPWRFLADICKEKVSAVPDGRFVNAPYYALDRIARAVSARPESASLLAPIDIPLPPVSLGATGVELPASPVTTPTAGPIVITVLKAEVHAGRLPHAHLGASGVALVSEGEVYPGPTVELAALDTALAALSPDAATPVTLLAPAQLPAARLVEVINAVKTRKVLVGVAAPGSPEGWTLPGTLPVGFRTTADPAATTWHVGESVDDAIRELKDKPAAAFAHPPTVILDAGATVANLVKLLGAIAFHDIHEATILATP